MGTVFFQNWSKPRPPTLVVLTEFLTAREVQHVSRLPRDRVTMRAPDVSVGRPFMAIMPQPRDSGLEVDMFFAYKRKDLAAEHWRVRVSEDGPCGIATATKVEQ